MEVTAEVKLEQLEVQVVVVELLVLEQEHLIKDLLETLEVETH